ncbi:MAG: hypothetical protein HYX72_09570 [Acidobacteria bacterium]|nr:hypothetical protein [Acidobacteriota bacterium]
MKRLWNDPLWTNMVWPIIVTLIAQGILSLKFAEVRRYWWIWLFVIILLVLRAYSSRIKQLISRLSAIPRLWRSKAAQPSKEPSPNTNAPPLLTVFCPAYTRNRIDLRVHDEFALEADSKIKATIEGLNYQRRSDPQKLLDYFNSTVFRLIMPPRQAPSGIELNLAAIDYFCYLTLQGRKGIHHEAKEHARKQLENVALKVSKKFQSSDPVLNEYNWHPLGIEMVVITKNQRTLLRRRGKSVNLAAGEWDVSYSGYLREKDKLDENGKLCVGLTANNELICEIGDLFQDLRNIEFTGFHVNRETGANDMLGFWKTEVNDSELVKLITGKYPGPNIRFGTDERAREQYVWDNENLVVDFDERSICEQLKEIEKSEGKSSALIPEARAALSLALQACGQNTTGELEMTGGNVPMSISN